MRRRLSVGGRRAHGIVRGWAELVEGTVLRFYCPSGHSWQEDMNRQSLPRPKRLGPSGCRLMASWWSKEKGGVTITCPSCRRAALKAEAKR